MKIQRKLFPIILLVCSWVSGQEASSKAEFKASLGQARLDALISELRSQVDAVRENALRLDSPAFAEARAKIDHEANQRDAYASGLYWHKDLAAAKAEALRTGRNILSLRLLGNLDEEYSCANSRFFRTLLYPNPEVSNFLRQHYVLHWKSVRPAPLITIDMGDGRRIKRTITGNSIHYILNPSGQVLDALPGIYPPVAFIQALTRAENNTRGKTAEQQRLWHGQEASQLCQEWLYAAVHAGAYGVEDRAALNTPEWSSTLKRLAGKAFPVGTDVGKLTFTFSPADLPKRFKPMAIQNATPEQAEEKFDIKKLFSHPSPIKEFPYPTDFDPPKGMVERPVIKRTLPGQAEQALDPASPEAKSPSLAGRMTANVWAQIATPFMQRSVGLASRRLMAQKQPPETLTEAEFKSGTPATGSAFDRMLSRFEIAIAGDMVRNEYFYHTQIHQILETDVDGKLSQDVESLNRKVYEELFLTPDYDAWLGLVPEDTYTALEKDGCACDAGAQPMRQKRQ
jgi:hypothetical protein